jgi:hypothetical protein
MFRARVWLAALLAISLHMGAGLANNGWAAQADDLPIVDLHLHLDPSWDLDDMLTVLDDLGVAQAGQSPRGPDSVAVDFAARSAGRFIPFGGDTALNNLVCRERGGYEQDAWELRVDAVRDYLDQLEDGLRAGLFRGIGELQLNRLPGSPNFLCRQPADSPLMRRLWEFSVAYQVPLFVHMDGTDEAIAEMERLLASDRRGTWVWLHTGMFVEPPALRDLLRRNPNLYLELSNRGSVNHLPHAVTLDADGTLRDEWRALIEEFPDRFLLGTDVPSMTRYADAIHFWRDIMAQLTPRTATLFASENARRLLRLP